MVSEVRRQAKQWLHCEEAACSANVGSISGSGRSLGGQHGNPLQYSCLENPMDRGVWQAIVYRVAKSRTQPASEHKVVKHA